MKKIIFLGLIMTLFIGCSTEEITEQNQELINTALKSKKADLVVTPSGDASGITDANAFQAALAALPSGGILLLESGTFYINRTIVAPDSFNGTMLGQGVNETQIIGVGNQNSPFIIVPSLFADTGSTFFLFVNPDGIVKMSDLWFNLPQDLYTNTIGQPRGLLTSFITVAINSNQCDTRFDNLRLTGFLRPDPPGLRVDESTPVTGIIIGGSQSTFPFPLSGGSHQITKSEISKIGFFPTIFSTFKNAEILLAGNTITETRQLQFQLLDGCDIIVKNNDINARDLGTLNFTQEGVPVPGNSNTVEIKNNTIITKGFANIEAGFATSGADFKLTIKNNHLSNLGTNPTVLGLRFPSSAVILINPGNEEIEVKDNALLGQSEYGIFQGSNLGTIKNNNLSNFVANQFDYILLGDNNELKVESGSSVDDQGSNNIIKN
jgi:hypothetical protein